MEPLKVMLVILIILAEFAAEATSTLTKDLLGSKSLPSATSLAHCPKKCGDANISEIFPDSHEDWPYLGQYYPFGFAPGCSRPGFELICNNSIYPPKLCLGDGTTEITYGAFYNNVGILEIKFEVHIMYSTVNNYSGSWNPGRPFMVYADDKYSSSFVVIGCEVDAYLFDENNIEIGNCSTHCKSDNEIRRQAGACHGIGCCSIPIDHRPSPIYFKINRNKKNSKLALQNVKAFMYTYHSVDGSDDDIAKKYILSQEDLYSVDTVQGMRFFNMLLEWSIPGLSTCEKAKENNTTYACVSNYSECTSNRNGYTCLCSPNYYGNAYIVDGCQDLNPYNRSWPEPNCIRHCGNISVPFPFGLSEGCYGKESFRLECRNAKLSISLNVGDDYLWPEGAENDQVMEVLVDEGLLQVYTSENESYSVAVEDSVYTSNDLTKNLTWVIDSITCQAATQDSNNYACISRNSECLDVNGANSGNLGYRCRCSPGYQGNPYLADGCKDIDECLQIPPICIDKVCNNTPGSYSCWECPLGTNFNPLKGGCIKVGRRSLLLGTIIGVISSIGVVIFTVGIIWARSIWQKEEKKRVRKKYFNKNEGILLQRLISSDERISQKTKNFSLHELEIATNNFDRARISGQGAHGTVYKGILLDQRVVAIKRAKLVNASEINQFINEVVLLSQIIHRNVVKLYGCCLETEVPLLVYEFISNGTLYSKLHESPDGTSSLTWGDRLRIAAEAAGALAYLHSAASISIFHRDLKSTNILLDDNYTAKLSDFGASRCVPIDQKQVVTTVQGTFGYLDPEYYYTGQLSEKSDVYSFGVIIVELLTRKKPIFTNSVGEPVNLSNYFLQALRDGSYVALLDNEVLEDCTQEELTTMIDLVEMCLKMRGEERPTMKDVEMRLQFIQISRKRQSQSAQTNEEGSQPEMAQAQLSHSSSLDTASWENQDTATHAILNSQSVHGINELPP